MSEDLELNYLKKKCYKIVDKIIRRGDISKRDLFSALAIRMKIPFGSCYINSFDLETCKKALKYLEIMEEDV